MSDEIFGNFCTDTLDSNAFRAADFKKINGELYGIEAGLPLEGSCFWATFDRHFSETFLKNRGDVTFWRDDWVGTNRDIWNEPVPYRLRASALTGFASLEDIKRYIYLCCTSVQARNEIQRSMSACFRSVITSHGESISDFMSYSPIYSAVKFAAENLNAVKCFKVWSNPDIHMVVYNLLESKQKSVTSVLTNISYCEFPKHSFATEQPDAPTALASPSLSLPGLSVAPIEVTPELPKAGTATSQTPGFNEEVKEFISENLSILV